MSSSLEGNTKIMPWGDSVGLPLKDTAVSTL